MKNMFFVINKEKVYAYVVSILTIVILFFMSHVINSDEQTDMVSGNVVQENTQNSVTTNEVSTDIKQDNTVDNTYEANIVPN